MSADPEKIIRDAMELPPEARAAIAGSLLESLDTIVDANAEAEWEREIARRMSDIDSAAVRPIPWSEARRVINGS